MRVSLADTTFEGVVPDNFNGRWKFQPRWRRDRNTGRQLNLALSDNVLELIELILDIQNRIVGFER